MVENWGSGMIRVRISLSMASGGMGILVRSGTTGLGGGSAGIDDTLRKIPRFVMYKAVSA